MTPLHSDPTALHELATRARRFIEPIWLEWHRAWGGDIPTIPSQWTCGAPACFCCAPCGPRASMPNGFRERRAQPPRSRRSALSAFSGTAAGGHAWVECGNFIVDINADQFGAAPVIVVDRSESRYNKGDRDSALPEFVIARQRAVDDIWPRWLTCGHSRPLRTDVKRLENNGAGSRIETMFPVALLLIGLLLTGIAYSLWHARAFTRRFPNVGELIDIGGYHMNSVHLPVGERADLPPVVFIHGASGNLLDQLHAFAPALDGRAEMLFVDRPGHGYSERGGATNDLPDGQAAAIAALMEKRGIRRAIIVGHSFGGAIAASFALHHPEKTAGLVLLAPATHPWPGGIDWYYHLTALPFVGWLFAHTLVTPLGQRRIERGTRSIFSPNPRPADYIDKTGPHLVLRPSTFLSNARDIANLHAYLTTTASRYREIAAPTVIITGDSDGIVLADIHSRGLARDIPGSQLVWIGNLGHKPDYVVTDVVVAALEKLAGQPTDLDEIKRRAEARLIARPGEVSQA